MVSRRPAAPGARLAARPGRAGCWSSEVQAEYVVRYGGPDEAPLDESVFDPPARRVLPRVRRRRAGGHGRLAAAVRRAPVGRHAGRGDQADVRRTGGPSPRATPAGARAPGGDRAAGRGARRWCSRRGPAQPEAIAMYAAAGYELIENFGYYAWSPKVALLRQAALASAGGGGLRGRLLDGVGDGEHLVQAGDPEDLEQVVLGADQREASPFSACARRRPPISAPRPVDSMKSTSSEVDDQVHVAGHQDLGDGVLELRAGGEVDVAAGAEDRVAVVPGDVDLAGACAFLRASRCGRRCLLNGAAARSWQPRSNAVASGRGCRPAQAQAGSQPSTRRPCARTGRRTSRRAGSAGRCASAPGCAPTSRRCGRR